MIHMPNAMKCGYDGEPEKGKIVQGNDICSRYVRSIGVDGTMFEVTQHVRMRPRTGVTFDVHVSKENAHHDLPNKAMKLRRLPIFFTFSVLMLS